MNSPLARLCVHCGGAFTARPKYPAQRFCGHKCQFAAQRGPAFNTRISRESAAARGDAQRNRGEGKTYRKLNGRHEHRVMAEQLLGRPLAPGEVVKFKDSNRRNLDPANLEVLPNRSEFARRIALKRHGR